MVISSTIRKYFLISIMTALVIFGIMGCSTSNSESPFSLIDETGKHPGSWTIAHPTYAGTDGSLCMDCHGNDLRGGISKVSCFSTTFDGQSCHAGGPAFHPDSWLDKLSADFHGTAYSTDPVSCAVCHDPGLPSSPPGYNCLDCHFSENGLDWDPSGYSHGDTSSTHQTFDGTADGDVCVACHGVNNTFGYEPNCHNCHALHPTGWDLRSAHGAAAKGNPDSTTGFSYCQSCHGGDFNGGTAGVSCLSTGSCHTVAAPHADGWKSEHDKTDQDNAVDCGLCHLGDPDPPIYQPLPASANPGCMNDTLCHGVED